jgi:hypothetical protein
MLFRLMATQSRLRRYSPGGCTFNLTGIGVAAEMQHRKLRWTLNPIQRIFLLPTIKLKQI